MLYTITSIMFFIAAIISFIVARNKKYSQRRMKEAERYFNGSVIKRRDYVDGGVRSSGLAFSKDKDGKYSFKKQSKLADTSLLGRGYNDK